MKCNYNLQDFQQQQSVTRSGLPLSLEWLEVLIYFFCKLKPLRSPYQGTILASGGLVLRARECASPAEAVIIHSLVTCSRRRKNLGPYVQEASMIPLHHPAPHDNLVIAFT